MSPQREAQAKRLLGEWHGVPDANQRRRSFAADPFAPITLTAPRTRKFVEGMA